MPTNPFLAPLGDNRTSAMSQPDLQNLRTPVSIGAQAIQRYLGNGAPRIANPLGYTTTMVNGAQPDPNAPPDGSGSDARDMASMGVSMQPSPGVDALRRMTAIYGADNGGTALDQVNENVGPTQQTAQGGVVGRVAPPDWGSYFRQRMGPPRGGRPTRAPMLMRQSRLANGGQ